MNRQVTSYPLYSRILLPLCLDSLEKHWFILAAVVVNAVSNVVAGRRVRRQQLAHLWD